MKSNVGSADKIIRILLGVVIIAAGLFYGSWLAVIGVIPILTAFMSFCPLYSIFGINTCGLKHAKR